MYDVDLEDDIFLFLLFLLSFSFNFFVSFLSPRCRRDRCSCMRMTSLAFPPFDAGLCVVSSGVCTPPSSQTARKLVRKTSSRKAYYSPFVQSTASLSKESSGWHCLAVTCESKFQFFYLDGKFKGAVPAVCTSSITCIGNARSLQGDFLVPFGCFNSIYIYDEAMPPSMVLDTYKEHTRLLKRKSFDPPLSSGDEDDEDESEDKEEEEEEQTPDRKPRKRE